MNRLDNLNRRRFLQGTGIALTLPAFESLSLRAAPGDKSPRRLVCVGNHLGFYPGNFFPKDAGKDYTPTASSSWLITVEAFDPNQHLVDQALAVDPGYGRGGYPAQAALTAGGRYLAWAA